MGSTEQTREGEAWKPIRGASGWTALAAILFVSVTLYRFQPVLETGLGESVPIAVYLQQEELSVWQSITEADLVYEVWLVSRNARALLAQPLDFFDGLHCTPFERSVTLGIPMVAMGVIAVPFSLFTNNPVLVYNLVLIALSLLACFAMFLLVRSWTGVPAAGIVAGLLFGFSQVRLGGIMHPSQFDDLWTVFALFFAARLFAHGRWRDAVGLAISFALQATESLYPFFAAVIVAPPLVAWMALSYGFRHTRLAPWTFTALFGAAVMAWMYLPYLETRSSGMLSERWGTQFYAQPLEYLPGGPLFPGFVVLVLAALALVAGRRGLARNIPGDPRPALLFGGLLAVWMATGPLLGWATGLPLPDLYSAAAALLPGLDNIRVVSRLSTGLTLTLCILSGVGTAALLRWIPNQTSAAAAGLIALAVATAAGAPGLAPGNGIAWTSQPLGGDPVALAFYEDLENRGNRGPVFELPFDEDPRTQSFAVTMAPPRIFLSHYHGRKISTCFGSFYPPGRGRLGSVASKLPAPGALEELSALGFTTLVAHHSPGTGASWRRRMMSLPSSGELRLHPIAETPRHTAWEIRNAAGKSPPVESSSNDD